MDNDWFGRCIICTGIISTVQGQDDGQCFSHATYSGLRNRRCTGCIEIWYVRKGFGQGGNPDGQCYLFYEPVKFHLDMATMAITALIVILFVALYFWYHRTMDARVHLVIELGNGMRYVRIRVLALNGALYAYSFHAEKYIQSLALIKWPPKLLVTWPSFAMRNILGQTAVEFPNVVWIPFWKIWQVSEIVHSKAYYCIIMTEYRQQYRLLEFENNVHERLHSMTTDAFRMTTFSDTNMYSLFSCSL